jgi:hypothetical protein
MDGEAAAHDKEDDVIPPVPSAARGHDVPRIDDEATA